MLLRILAVACLFCVGGCAATRTGVATAGNTEAQPLIIGQSFTIQSRLMGEARRVNVFEPTVYGQKNEVPFPVLYVLDGGMDEDFLHIAGLAQVLVSNGGMRPFLLVGIPNTQRRRDLSGPTDNAEDKKMAPVVGGSAMFRRFIKEELMPAVKSRYRTTDETAIVGESLAGLFALETLVLEPGLFGSYIAIDPSLWWNDEGLVKAAAARLPSSVRARVFLASSEEPTTQRLCKSLVEALGPGGSVTFTYEPFPSETHATIYHPAALRAFRTVFAKPPEPSK